MKIVRTCRCAAFIAGDRSILCEILNPGKNHLGINYSLARARVKARSKTLPHRLKYTEVYFILSGKGMMHVDRQKEIVQKGDAVYIPPNAVQYIENFGSINLDFLCIVNPPWQPACETVFARKDRRSKLRRH